MKKEKLAKILLPAVCALALAACGARPDPPAAGAPAASGPSGSSAGSPMSGAASTPAGSGVEVRGSVVEISDGFCVITPMETDAGDDKVAYGAAPGYEDPEKNITVRYQAGCTVQIAEINAATGEKDLADAAVSDIQQQVSLIVYGEWAGERELNAAAIYIVRYQ